MSDDIARIREDIGEIKGLLSGIAKSIDKDRADRKDGDDALHKRADQADGRLKSLEISRARDRGFVAALAAGAGFLGSHLKQWLVGP